MVDAARDGELTGAGGLRRVVDGDDGTRWREPRDLGIVEAGHEPAQDLGVGVARDDDAAPRCLEPGGERAHLLHGHSLGVDENERARRGQRTVVERARGC